MLGASFQAAGSVGTKALSPEPHAVSFRRSARSGNGGNSEQEGEQKMWLGTICFMDFDLEKSGSHWKRYVI